MSSAQCFILSNNNEARNVNIIAFGDFAFGWRMCSADNVYINIGSARLIIAHQPSSYRGIIIVNNAGSKAHHFYSRNFNRRDHGIA